MNIHFKDRSGKLIEKKDLFKIEKYYSVHGVIYTFPDFNPTDKMTLINYPPELRSKIFSILDKVFLQEKNEIISILNRVGGSVCREFKHWVKNYYVSIPTENHVPIYYFWYPIECFNDAFKRKGEESLTLEEYSNHPLISFLKDGEKFRVPLYENGIL